jgi:hypothetical protein
VGRPAGRSHIDTDARRFSMARKLVWGAVAGMLGTVVLNVVTYLDMLVRGRGSSSVPADTAGRLADEAGIELSSEGPESKTAANRRSALGSLMGYVAGISVGLVYGAVRPRLRSAPVVVAGVGAGVAAMAASDVPAAGTGATDPRSWGTSGWLSDVIPHAAYGIATAVAYDRLAA